MPFINKCMTLCIPNIKWQAFSGEAADDDRWRYFWNCPNTLLETHLVTTYQLLGSHLNPLNDRWQDHWSFFRHCWNLPQQDLAMAADTPYKNPIRILLECVVCCLYVRATVQSKPTWVYNKLVFVAGWLGILDGIVTMRCRPVEWCHDRLVALDTLRVLNQPYLTLSTLDWASYWGYQSCSSKRYRHWPQGRQNMEPERIGNTHTHRTQTYSFGDTTIAPLWILTIIWWGTYIEPYTCI